MSPAILVQKVHFDDFGGIQFERLVFAYMLRTRRWRSLDWYGQLGTDLGRDIWGESGNSKYNKVCIQCANRKRLTISKVVQDVDLIVSGPFGVPDEFILVLGGNISARLRDKIRNFVAKKGIRSCSIWSGQEFEERLRAEAESLLKRFVQGEEFPESPSDLSSFIEQLKLLNDVEILALMAELFDRPAFYTPFQSESSIPAFKKAITDTIEALNTGIHRLRDGTEIRRIPSRHQIKKQRFKKALSEIVKELNLLRITYDDCLRQGEIRPCNCQDPNCPVFFISSEAASKMDILRNRILGRFKRIYPPFEVHLAPTNHSAFLRSKTLGPSPVVATYYIPPTDPTKYKKI